MTDPDDVIQHALLPGERVLWSGQPTGLGRVLWRLTRNDRLFLGLVVFFGICIATTLSERGGWSKLYPVIALFGAIIAWRAIQILGEASRHLDQRYALTDFQRAISLEEDGIVTTCQVPHPETILAEGSDLSFGRRKVSRHTLVDGRLQPLSFTRMIEHGGLVLESETDEVLREVVWRDLEDPAIAAETIRLSGRSDGANPPG